jgi:hypothetical protein
MNCAMTSVMESNELIQGNQDDAQAAYIGSMGFLTPPVPYESRRDSIASSQSYYSSFTASDYSMQSEYSMPQTPVNLRSPLSDHDYVDAGAYAIGQDLLSNNIDGLPLANHQKDPMGQDALYEPWVMVQQPTVQHSNFCSPFTYPHVVSLTVDSGMSLQSYGTAHGLNSLLCESSWTTIGSHPDSDPSCHNRQSLSREMISDFSDVGDIVKNNFRQPRTRHMGTIVPANATFDMCQVGYGPEPSRLNESAAQDHLELSFPTSPQEVSFKREDSVFVKEEVGVARSNHNLKGRTCTTSTKAKTLGKNRCRNGGVSKQKSKPSKARGQSKKDLRDIIADGRGGFEDVYGNPIAKVAGVWQRVGGHTTAKHRCGFKNPDDGSICTKPFKRTEHLKRHQRTHLGEVVATCMVPKCNKPFDRSDNCYAHYFTHLRGGVQKHARNPRFSFRKVLRYLARSGDLKMYDRFRNKNIRLFDEEEPEAADDVDDASEVDQLMS